MTSLGNGANTFRWTIPGGLCSGNVQDDVIITYNTLTAPSPNDDHVCNGTAASLTATTSGGGTIEWYDAASGGNLLNSGNSYTPSPATTTTYYVQETVSGGNGDSVLTTFSGGGNFDGEMFEVTALNDIIITGFSQNAQPGTATYEIYYKTGSYLGFETNAGAWTLAGSASVTTAVRA